jgi:hypothetical protein
MRLQAAVLTVILFPASFALAAAPGTCLNPIQIPATEQYSDHPGWFGITPAHRLVFFSKPISVLGTTIYGAVRYNKHCKHAIIAYDWGDPGFVGEAQSVGAALTSTGQWDVTYIDPTFVAAHPSDGTQLQLVLDAGNSFVSSPGDEILLDIQAHGAEATRTFTLPNGNAVGPTTYTEALANPALAQTIQYPYEVTDHTSPDYATTVQYYETHWDSDHMNAGELAVFADHFASQQYLVTIIDHGCFGGSTSYLFDQSVPSYNDTNVCTITTDGVMTPGLLGVASISQFLASEVQNGQKFSFDDVANYISQQYLDNTNRSQSTGHKTGCNQTLALRDTMSLAGGSYSTWWDWIRDLHSLVLRQPEAFTDDGNTSPSPPIDNSPRQAISPGWTRWFYASVNKFYNENQFAAWVAGQEQASPTANALVATILSQGITFYGYILGEEDWIWQFEYDLQRSHVFPNYYPPSRGYTADAYARALLTNSCLCQNASLVSQFGLTCDPNATPFWPGNADGQTPWIDGIDCNNPSATTAFVMSNADDGQALSQDLSTVQLFESTTLPQAGQALLTSIQQFEQGCVSPACAAQSVF